VTSKVKAAVKVKVKAVKIEVKAPSINYSYTDLLAAALYFVVMLTLRQQPSHLDSSLDTLTAVSRLNSSLNTSTAALTP
jgi:hypothetical protein